jgi:hypothetical protein
VHSARARRVDVDVEVDVDVDVERRPYVEVAQPQQPPAVAAVVGAGSTPRQGRCDPRLSVRRSAIAIAAVVTQLTPSLHNPQLEQTIAKAVRVFDPKRR